MDITRNRKTSQAATGEDEPDITDGDEDKQKVKKFPPEPEANPQPKKQQQKQEQELQRKALICMALLTLQYGAQPILTQYFTGGRVIMTSVVLACEFVKVLCAIVAIAAEGSLGSTAEGWRLQDALKGSALPAVIYAVQNTLVQVSYRNLESLTASLLNQTKLAFTALFMFIFLGYRQSRQQVAAILVLLLAATLLTLGKRSPKKEIQTHQNSIVLGVVPIVTASVLSGLASSLCQWAVQVKKRSSYLMTVEMSFIGCASLLLSLLSSPDGAAVREKGFFFGWDAWTAVPVVTNAVGGILVGLVTQYAGGVKKGFVVVSGLLVTAVLQVLIDRAPPSWHVVAALPLVVGSSVVHQRYPYVGRKEEKKVQ